jgi:hypothetical protein
VPVSVNAGLGVPVVVTVNVPADPTAKLVWSALVIAGGAVTVNVAAVVVAVPAVLLNTAR